MAAFLWLANSFHMVVHKNVRWGREVGNAKYSDWIDIVVFRILLTQEKPGDAERLDEATGIVIINDYHKSQRFEILNQ